MPETSAERAIGRIEGKIDGIADEIERTRQIRKEQYELFEKMARRLDDADRKLDIVTKRIEEQDVFIKVIKVWRERFIGMWILIAFLSAATGATLATTWKWIALRLGLL